VWACPICSAAVREQRSAYIEDVTTAALRAGGEVEFVTLTMPHTRDDFLAGLLLSVSESWRRVTSDRRWKDSARLVGFVRATEVTDGMPNGWHPHLHVLVFFDGERSQAERVMFREDVEAAWRASVLNVSGRLVGHGGVGVLCKPIRLVKGRADVGEYLAKVQDGYDGNGCKPVGSFTGRELARADAKRGRRRNRWTPFQLAERANLGDRRARARWLEYEDATKGRRCLEWSRSRKWRAFLEGLGLEVDDATDDELAAATPGEVIAELSPAEWARVARYGAQARLLDVAEMHGLAGILRVLSALARRDRLEQRRRERREKRAGTE
jgi:hypothetical protein